MSIYITHYLKYIVNYIKNFNIDLILFIPFVKRKMENP